MLWSMNKTLFDQPLFWWDCVCFKKYHKMIARDVSKQQALDVDPAAMVFIIEDVKKTILDFSQTKERVL